MLTITIILGVLFLIVCYVAYIQYSKVSRLEDIANTLANHLNTIQTIIQSSKESLDNPRLVQAFSSDDEVGTFFKQLKGIQQELDQYLFSDEKDK